MACPRRLCGGTFFVLAIGHVCGYEIEQLARFGKGGGQVGKGYNSVN